MAFLFFDSCGDDLGTGTTALPGDWATTVNATVTASGRTGNAFTRNAAAAWYAQTPTVSLPQSRPFTIGFGFETTALPASPGSIMLVNSGTPNVELDLTPTGNLSIINGPATTTTPIAGGTFYFIEINFPLGLFPSAGALIPTVSISVNGTLLVSANYTGVVPTSITNVVVGNAMLSSTFTGLAATFIDDFYFLDGTSTSNNTLLGPQVVKVSLPTGAGHVTQLTPNGAGANWQCVNGVPPSGVTFVSSTTVGQKDAYALAAITGISQLNGVKSSASALQTVSGGGRTLNIGVSNGTLDSYGSPVSLTTSYVKSPVVFNINPFTAAAWALGDLSTLQASIQVAT